MQERQVMQRKVIKTKEFELPVYGAGVVFIYTNSFEEAAKFAETHGFHEKDVKTLAAGSWVGYTFNVTDDNIQGKSYSYIFILKKDKYSEINIISHEITHAVYEILTIRGLRFNKHNEEAYAYLIGYLNEEFHKFKDGK